jgi:arginyl-tRNA synthetase
VNIYKTFEDKLRVILQDLSSAGQLPSDLDMTRVVVEPPRDRSHGDMATNAAMVLSKLTKKAPRDLAAMIAPELEKLDEVETVEIAGPGFINFRLKQVVWAELLNEILSDGVHYGDTDIGQNEAVNIEYVSANPTGPMHAGHTRGAVVGDTLANLLQKSGYNVTREYYFNDAGTQVDVLARTAYLRYREALGEDIGEIPDGMYPGEYMKDLASALVERDGDKWLDLPEEQWIDPIREFAVEYIMVMIREDLRLIGIKHDVFTNEREIVENVLPQAFKFLEDRDLVYTGTLPPPRGKEMDDWEPVPLTLFRSSNYGDASDRPLKKRDGTWAYIMPDIAYHFDKVNRGFYKMVNLLGKDHGGYEDRLNPAIQAFSDGKAELKVIYNSIVKVLRDGKLVKFSKRSGNVLTLREMVEEVGADAVRFFMMTRTPDSELEFDFNKVVEQSKDNPVFYVQYAHARCCSVMRNAAEMFPDMNLSAESLKDADLTKLSDADTLQLVQVMAAWPRMVEASAEAYEPHRVAFYLYELASEFHSLWSKGRSDASLRFLDAEDIEVSWARLARVRAMMVVLSSGLAIMGVEPAEEMHN